MSSRLDTTTEWGTVKITTLQMMAKDDGEASRAVNKNKRGSSGRSHNWGEELRKVKVQMDKCSVLASLVLQSTVFRFSLLFFFSNQVEHWKGRSEQQKSSSSSSSVCPPWWKDSFGILDTKRWSLFPSPKIPSILLLEEPAGHKARLRARVETDGFWHVIAKSAF